MGRCRHIKVEIDLCQDVEYRDSNQKPSVRAVHGPKTFFPAVLAPNYFLLFRIPLRLSTPGAKILFQIVPTFTHTRGD